MEAAGIAVASARSAAERASVTKRARRAPRTTPMTAIFMMKGNGPLLFCRRGPFPFMVEAAGIEPASEKVRTKASTRLVRSFFFSPFYR